MRIFLGPVTGDLAPDDADFVFLPEARFHTGGPPMLAIGDFFGDDATDVIVLAWRDDAVYGSERTVAWGWTGPLEPGTFIPESADYVLTITGEAGPRSPRAVVATPCHPFEHDKDALVILHYDAIDVPRGQHGSEPMLSLYVWERGASRSRLLDAYDARMRNPSLLVDSRHPPACADFDGDGLDELVLPIRRLDAHDEQPARGPGVGLIRLERGQERRGVDAVVMGEPPEVLGAPIEVVPDLTGDGLPELAVGATAPLARGVSPAVHVFASSPFDLEADLSIVGEPDSRLGDRIAAGDVTGDGVPDLVLRVLHPQDDARIQIFSGTDLRVPIAD